MFVFQRKDGCSGEIHVIVTQKDRAQMFVEGINWVNLNDTLNDFNKDDNITDCKLCAVYTGDLNDEAIRAYIDENYNQKSVSSNNDNSNKKKSKKEKVDSNGRIIKTDEDGEEWESDENLEEYLSGEDLECPKCGDKGSALINKSGEILPCKSCIEIDAYLKGKKKGYEKGFEEGYNKCMAIVEKLMSVSKETIKEVSNININDLIKESEKDNQNENN